MPSILHFTPNKAITISLFIITLAGVAIGGYKVSDMRHEVTTQSSVVAGISTNLTNEQVPSPTGDTNLSTPQPSSQPTPKSTKQAAVTNSEKVVDTNNKITVPNHVAPTKAATPDPNVKIEICRTRAKQEKSRYMEIGVQTFQQEKAGVYELAKTSSRGETETVALKYGHITQAEIVRYEDAYQKRINEGVSPESAHSIAKSMGDAYYAYLTKLHNWAKEQFDTYMSQVETNATTYENDVYAKCLNS